MRRPFDPADGWPVITRREFIGDVILAIIGMTALIVICALVIVTQTPETHP